MPPCALLFFGLVICILLPNSLAQPSYTSSDGLWQVYPPPPYTYPDVTSFSQIAGYGARGQWGLSVVLGDSTTPGVWSAPINCSTPAMNGCVQPGALQTLGTGLVKVNYKWRNMTSNSIKMMKGTSQIPSTLEFYMCYSNVAFDDRPWRKKNKAYPSMTQNCFFWISTSPFPSNVNPSNLTFDDKTTKISSSTIYEMTYNDQLPTTTLFFMMWLRCTDGSVCAFESTESPSVLNSSGLYYRLPYTVGPYIQVEGYTGITPGMTAAAVILSAFGPLFFIGYYIADHMYYTKTGRALSIA